MHSFFKKEKLIIIFSTPSSFLLEAKCKEEALTKWNCLYKSQIESGYFTRGITIKLSEHREFQERNTHLEQVH